VAETLSRKLAVILHADVVGSTGLVQRDERLAHARIQDAFRRFSETIECYGGNVHEIRGDALLAECDRASDAVSAALAFQTANTEHSHTLDDEIQPVLRVGISLGEVVIANGTLTGPDVVLAQRLEQLAEAGNVCISLEVQHALPKRLPFEYVDLGDQQVKGFDEPVRAYAVTLRPGADIPAPDARARTGKTAPWHVAAISVAAGALIIAGIAWWRPWASGVEPASVETMAVSQSGKPSIAVLPFANMSEDPNQDYFADGISEDIITDLSQLANLIVIARNSSFSYKGTNVKVQEIGEELGARYVLEGSFRKSGDRLRITAQLVDTGSGHHLWAQRYDRQLTEVFALQDDITGRIVDALSVQLSDDEKRALGRVATNSFEAYDLFLQGRRHYDSFTAEGFERARELFRQAIVLDPQFTRAYSSLANTLMRLAGRGEADSPAETLIRAADLVDKALSIDPSSAHAYRVLGVVKIYQNRFDEALDALQDSLALAPNDGDSYAWLALVYNYMGRGEDAVRMIDKATELNPHSTWNYDYNLGRAYYSMGKYGKAAEALQSALERNENSILSRLYLAASYVQLDQQDDAEWEVMQIEVLDPSYTLSKVTDLHPLKDESLKNRLLSDLRSAGLPE